MTPQTHFVPRPSVLDRAFAQRFALQLGGLSVAAALCFAGSPARAQSPAASSSIAAYGSAQGFADRARATSPFEVAAIEPAAEPSSFSSSVNALPDDPSAPQVSSLAQANPLRGSFSQTTADASRVAPLYDTSISPGWTAQPLSGGQKLAFSIRETVSFDGMAKIFIAAGWDQLRNSDPNYGTDRGAFGERLGAAGLHEATENFFSDGILAAALQEDPRYYIEGPSRNFFHRAIYAATRSLVTRTDGGHSTVNASLLGGYAASAALTYAYYPPINRNARDTAETYGDSILGSALGFLYAEFSPDIYQALHLHKKQ